MESSSLTKISVGFDLDGTILDSLSSIMRAMNECLVEYGSEPVDVEFARKYIGYGVKDTADRYLKDKSSEKKFVEEYGKRLGQYSMSSPLFSGVKEMLITLQKHGACILLISNKPQAGIELFKQQYGSELNFDAFVGQRSGQRPKPETEIFAPFISDASENKSQIIDWKYPYEITNFDFIYVGDTEVDFLTAKNLKCQCIMCAYGFRGKALLKPLGAPIIEAPLDLLKLLKL